MEGFGCVSAVGPGETHSSPGRCLQSCMLRFLCGNESDLVKRSRFAKIACIEKKMTRKLGDFTGDRAETIADGRLERAFKKGDHFLKMIEYVTQQVLRSQGSCMSILPIPSNEFLKVTERPLING